MSKKELAALTERLTLLQAMVLGKYLTIHLDKTQALASSAEKTKGGLAKVSAFYVDATLRAQPGYFTAHRDFGYDGREIKPRRETWFGSLADALMYARNRKALMFAKVLVTMDDSIADVFARQRAAPALGSGDGYTEIEAGQVGDQAEPADVVDVPEADAQANPDALVEAVKAKREPAVGSQLEIPPPVDPTADEGPTVPHPKRVRPSRAKPKVESETAVPASVKAKADRAEAMSKAKRKG